MQKNDAQDCKLQSWKKEMPESLTADWRFFEFGSIAVYFCRFGKERVNTGETPFFKVAK